MTLQLCWFATEGSQEPLQTRKPVPHFKCSASFFGQAEQGSYPCSYSFAPSGLSLRSAYRGLYPRLCSSAPSGLFPAFCLPGFTPGCALPPLRSFSTVQLANLWGAYFSCRAVGPAPRRLAYTAQPRLLAASHPQCVQASTLSFRYLTLSFMHLTLFYTILHYSTLLTTYDTVRRVRV